MINGQSISQTCPKGWGEWNKSYWDKSYGLPFADETFHYYEKQKFNSLIGDLLAFFDERWIRIHEFYSFPSTQWLFLVYNGSIKLQKENRFYDSRPQALAAAFTEAFRVLEEKL